MRLLILKTVLTLWAIALVTSCASKPFGSMNRYEVPDHSYRGLNSGN